MVDYSFKLYFKFKAMSILFIHIVKTLTTGRSQNFLCCPTALFFPSQKCPQHHFEERS